MPIVYLDERKFTLSDEIIKMFGKYIVNEANSYYVYNINYDTFTDLLKDIRDDYTTVSDYIKNNMSQIGGYIEDEDDKNINTDVLDTGNNTIILDIPNSDTFEEVELNEEDDDVDIDKIAKEYIEMIGGEEDNEEDIQEINIDTSVLDTGNQDEINNLINSIEEGLKSNASFGIMHKLSTDPNIIKIIKAQQDSELDPHSDSLAVPDSFFSDNDNDYGNDNFFDNDDGNDNYYNKATDYTFTYPPGNITDTLNPETGITTRFVDID